MTTTIIIRDEQIKDYFDLDTETLQKEADDRGYDIIDEYLEVAVMQINYDIDRKSVEWALSTENKGFANVDIWQTDDFDGIMQFLKENDIPLI